MAARGGDQIARRRRREDVRIQHAARCDQIASAAHRIGKIGLRQKPRKIGLIEFATHLMRIFERRHMISCRCSQKGAYLAGSNRRAVLMEIAKDLEPSLRDGLIDCGVRIGLQISPGVMRRTDRIDIPALNRGNKTLLIY